MSKHRLSKFERSIDGRLWHPLFIAANARKLKSGDVDAVLAWLDKCGDELQGDIDSVRFTFPEQTPEYDFTRLRHRIENSRGTPEQLTAIADEMLALDLAIRSTDERLTKLIPDSLLDGDTSVEEMSDYALKIIEQKKRKRT